MTNERAQIVAKLTDLKKRSSAVTAQFAERMAEIERQVGGCRMVTVIGGDDGLVASVDINLRGVRSGIREGSDVGLIIAIVGVLVSLIGYFLEAGNSQGRADTLSGVLSGSTLPEWPRPSFSS